MQKAKEYASKQGDMEYESSLEDFIKGWEEAINYNQCSTQLKDKEEQIFSEWIESNGYYLKEGNWFNKHGYSRDINKLKK